MLNREIYLIVNNLGGRIGEFLIELNYDQPGILAALSNVFADNNANILNIALDSGRTKMHFIVDITSVEEQDLEDLPKKLGMFAFTKRVHYRYVSKRIFVPRWIVHVINNEPALALERDFVAKINDLERLAVDIAKRDAEIIKSALQNGDIDELREAVYIVQLRGLATVQEDASTANVVNVKYCRTIYPMFRRYIETLISSISNRSYRLIDEGACIRLQIA
ncbi:ACT domain-containing protein [Thermoproteus tenax]|uniref:ACT domain-containing protein n=1 Tax=Thermoproteus tenax (strain ATCC 35583 / DSM 2078 / JCM 9277 / NBRC 100435 / Kra 1) TaxID=768679 RepID=G4RPT8_THETK|nr:ACT domain-containing protein [Thermoproteus tenax]CCC81583.1 ACT domain-containing protein [Thermoproteus tenax Kra 1]